MKMKEISVGEMESSQMYVLRNKSAHWVIKVMTSEELASQEDHGIECVFLSLKK